MSTKIQGHTPLYLKVFGYKVHLLHLKAFSVEVFQDTRVGCKFKSKLIEEFNALNIEGMPKVKSLNALVGAYINMEYRLPNGKTVKFLDDNTTYLGNQLESEFGGNRCFGIAANMDFLLVCTYEEKGENPELVVYKKR